MKSPRVKITVDNVAKVFAGIADLAETRVYAGIPADKAERSEEDGEPINNAQLMYIHENGAPEANIPARPVVDPAIKSVKGDLADGLKQAGQHALSGNLAAMDRDFNRVGITAQNAMRKRITDGPFAPLAERTLAARRAAGYKGDKPLIRTGQLRRALTYVIRRVAWAGKRLWRN